MRTFLAIAAIGFMFCSSFPAQATLHMLGKDDGQKAVEAKMPEQWLACNKNSDCGLIPYNCGEALGVNTNHLSEAKKLAYQIVSDPATMNCVFKPGVSGPPNYVAGCVSGVCEATNPTE